ncbi:MAG: glycosyltransferase [Chitinophagaceae bacterium]|nr:MAG: glycosyltransferase [Chitinophagaceae bacterium]
MLVQVIKKLHGYRNIVVALERTNHFENELECDEYICLDKPGFLSLPAAVIALRKLVKDRNIDLVHSHLPLSNFVARLGVPASVPLVTTIHNSIATSGDYKKWFIRFLDRTTYRFRPSTMIFVSQNAQSDYFSVLKMKDTQGVLLYNFVDISLYPENKSYDPGEPDFKMVCVAALSRQKNLGFLIEGLGSIKDQAVSLDIFGKGELQSELQDAIERNNAVVTLKGQVKNINQLLPHYQLYVMSSLFEGFSLSVLEAMAAGLPLLLSDIPSFREQCGNNAIYFDLADRKDLEAKLLFIKNNRNLRIQMSESGRRYVAENFTIEKHIAGLIDIYNATLQNHKELLLKPD